MKIVPQAFFNAPHVTSLLSYGTSSLFKKEVRAISEDNSRYLSSHAFIYVTKGGLHIEHENAIGQNIGQYELVFLPKGSYYISDLIPEKGSFEAYVLFVAHDELQSFSASLGPKRFNHQALQGIHHFPTEARLHPFLESVGELNKTESKASEALVKGFIAHFLATIFSLFETAEFEQKIHALAQLESTPVEQIVLHNYLKPLTVSQLASLCNQSTSTFQRSFKSLFGESPKRWLIARRLEHAEQLLRQNLTVQEIASKSGFNDIPHFIRTFESQHRQTPKQYQLSLRLSRKEEV